MTVHALPAARPAGCSDAEWEQRVHVGETVSEAFMCMYWLVYQCRIVTHLHAMGRPYRSLPEGMAAENARLAREGSAPGRHEWPALLRRLDRIVPHYRT